ncbi:hypothetical protein D3C81_1895300 [compost metagenome]
MGTCSKVSGGVAGAVECTTAGACCSSKVGLSPRSTNTSVETRGSVAMAMVGVAPSSIRTRFNARAVFKRGMRSFQSGALPA